MKTPSRVGIIHLALAAFVVAILIKAAQVQFWQGTRFTKSAISQQSRESTIPAPRGEIRDSRGELLAQSREKVTLAISPKESGNMPKLRSALLRAKISPDIVARVTRDPDRKWIALPGHYLATDVAGLFSLRGVYPTPIVERVYAMSDGMRRIIGRVDASGKALDGIELSLDSLLKGTPGVSIVMHDVRGKGFESPSAPPTPAVQGNTIVLTINQELQEIAERALGDAVSRMGAEGGDVLVLDPSNGEILAMASQRADPRNTASTALTEPYEPGSTLKPLVAAVLMEQGKAKESDVVPTYGGVLVVNGRPITDEHKANEYTLADVIRYSSNIGIVKFTERLTAREQFEALRDFGFGSPTGMPYPVEASGTLREPAKWSKQSSASLAMGYEIAVTPLQLASAYVAIGNNGELLEPAIVKEVRAPDGTVLFAHHRRVVRRVLSGDVSRRMRGMLLGVVEGGGTAKRADLGSFALAGKTGTARRTVNGSYAGAQHIPTFVGLFPGDNPQFVILVKLDNPTGAYMGGLTAAPVTKVLLEAALASRDASLNKRSLAASRRQRTPDSSRTSIGLNLANAASHETTTVAKVESAPSPPTSSAENRNRGDPFVVLLGTKPSTIVTPIATRVIPDVHGLATRDAVRALHSAGFRVKLGSGLPGETSPVAGASAAAGSVVQLQAVP